MIAEDLSLTARHLHKSLVSLISVCQYIISRLSDKATSTPSHILVSLHEAQVTALTHFLHHVLRVYTFAPHLKVAMVANTMQ